MEDSDRYGILTSITWSSTGWTKPFTKEDLEKSKYDYVRDNGEAADHLNFGHEVYPSEADGTYIGYSPMLNRNPQVQDLGAVFFLSSDYQHDNRKCIVGVYGFSKIGEIYRQAKHPIFKKFSFGNVRASVEDIVYFAKPVVIDAVSVVRENLLPAGKKISQQGFNYLTAENAVNILRLAKRNNPQNAKLQVLLEKLGQEEEGGGKGLGGLVDDPDAGTLGGIADLEANMRTMKPEQKQRVSTYIERGRIATLAKRHTGYKCLLCEAMGLNPIGFLKKEDGDPYVEAHHVDQVANLAVGALGLANIITLCANHHRQMHYGDVQLLGMTKTQFKFQVDGKEYVLKKIKV